MNMSSGQTENSRDNQSPIDMHSLPTNSLRVRDREDNYQCEINIKNIVINEWMALY